MGDCTLSEVFDTVYEEEFSEFYGPTNHFFSFRHRKAMKNILYPHTVSPFTAKHKIPLKRRAVIAMIIILLSILGIAACAVISRSFAFEERRGRTALYAVNDKNAPITIETLYHLPIVPDGFEPFYENLGSYDFFVEYFDASADRVLFFSQGVKNGFSIANVDIGHIEETHINGSPAYYYCYDTNGGVIVWDNKDYILEVGGNFTKNELIEFAESVELKDA